MPGAFCYAASMTTRTRLSLDEFLALPGIDERRLELLDGEVYEKVSPRWGHSRIALRIGAMFDAIRHAGVEPRAVIRQRADRAGSSLIPESPSTALTLQLTMSGCLALPMSRSRYFRQAKAAPRCARRWTRTWHSVSEACGW